MSRVERVRPVVAHLITVSRRHAWFGVFRQVSAAALVIGALALPLAAWHAPANGSVASHEQYVLGADGWWRASATFFTVAGLALLVGLPTLIAQTRRLCPRRTIVGSMLVGLSCATSLLVGIALFVMGSSTPDPRPGTYSTADSVFSTYPGWAEAVLSVNVAGVLLFYLGIALIGSAHLKDPDGQRPVGFALLLVVSTGLVASMAGAHHSGMASTVGKTGLWMVVPALAAVAFRSVHEPS